MEKITQNPVKFAILKLTEKDPKTGKVYTIGKMVSKCFLKETRETIYPNGHIATSFTVNFPFSDIETFQKTMFTLKPNIGNASFDSENKVEEVFDTYEEAKERLEEDQIRTKKLCFLRGSLKDPNWKQNKEKTLAILNKYNAICNAYEAAVLDATKDMIVDEKGHQKVNKK